MTSTHNLSTVAGICVALSWAATSTVNPPANAQEFRHRGDVVQIFGTTGDKEKLITASASQTLWIWELQSGKLINRINKVLHAMLSVDGSTLIVVSQFGRGGLRLEFQDTSRNLGKAPPERRVQIPGYTQSLTISPDGSWLAYCYGRFVHLVNRDHPDRDRKITLQIGKGENTGFQVLEFGPDDSTLVVGTQLAGRRMYRFLNCNDGSVIAEGKGEPNIVRIEAEGGCLVTAGDKQIFAIDMKSGEESFSVWKWFEDRELDSCAYLGNGKIVQTANAVGATKPFTVRGGSSTNNQGILIITRTATYFPAEPSKPGLLAFGDVKSGLEKTVVIPAGVGPPVVSPGKDRIAFETGEGVQVWRTNPPVLDFKIGNASLPFFTDNQILLHRSKKRQIVIAVNMKPM